MEGRCKVMSLNNPFGSLAKLDTASGQVSFYSLRRLEEEGIGNLSQLPYTIRILLENMLRHCDGRIASEAEVEELAHWNALAPVEKEIPFVVARVIMQDFTGVPGVADLAAMRAAVARLGGDAARINPIVPVDLVIDHSVQVDYFGTKLAFQLNVEREYERNRERYEFLRWAQGAFRNFRVVPPGSGIVHQVNLECLATVVCTSERSGQQLAYPDTLVGTDSHTTMVNGLGVLGWGVGGIEAEAAMLGQPLYMLTPPVVGVRLTGQLREGVLATDLVLTITELLRKRNVVGKFVEFIGPGVATLSLADRATLGNMAPEYGATCGFFPVDHETLNYLRTTGRSPALIDLVERYTKEQGLFRTQEGAEPMYSELVELDLSTVEPSLAGPRRPQDRVPLHHLKHAFREILPAYAPSTRTWDDGNGQGKISEGNDAALAVKGADERAVEVSLDGTKASITDGSVVIAAITSCTNTSNPSVMVGAGLLAKKAVERGLTTKPWVKTSLAPGSQVVIDYLERAGLMPYLEALRFHLVGFGCTTCIGNSGPLPEAIAEAIREKDLVVASVLSGNRNFEGRINPLAKLAYLASPPLVVAFALAGTVDIDLTSEPIDKDPSGNPVFLKDIWPTSGEIRQAMENSIDPEMFRARYARLFEGDERWRSLSVPEGELFQWNPASTYVQEPPFFTQLTLQPPPVTDILGARVLAMLGDTITTDHISPAGPISADSPAGRYLIERGVKPSEFNSYGARRGNHEVMVRGTFANIRLRNELTPGREGGWTVHLPDGQEMTIYDAAMRYREEGIPLLVIAGKEYGAGSSRDWAAKGTALLGIRAVIAESFERIHRSNLVGMGVLPLQFLPGEGRKTLGLTGREIYSIVGIAEGLTPQKVLTVRAQRDDGNEITFKVTARLDTPIEVDYYRQGGILPAVLRQMLTA
jgi:aconitate hydratase